MACSGVGEQATNVGAPPTRAATTQSTTTTSREVAAPSSTNTAPQIDQGDLGGWELVSVSVAEQVLLVAFADDPTERARGLMGVEDFGDVDGMLFAFAEDSSTGFWMKDTLVPLDVAFFDRAGILVDALTMEPCEADPCPVYLASEAFAWALETPAGSLGDPPPDATIMVGDG